MNESVRRCTVCHQEKSLTEFSLNRKTGRPVNGRCKACHAAAERKRRLALPKRSPGLCADCNSSLAERGPQALLCAACARVRRRRRGSSPTLSKRREVGQVLDHLRQGESQLEACRSVGISWSTLRRRIEADTDFARLVSAAVSVGKSVRLRPCGTLAKYERGCRCVACRSATARASARWRQTIRNEASTTNSVEGSGRGRMADAPWDIPHGLSGRLNYLCMCEICRSAGREASRRWQRIRNDRLLDQAKRHNAQWTGPELEIAARDDLSASQAAEILGRTMWAVQTMRKRMRVEPSQQWLAGRRSRLH